MPHRVVGAVTVGAAFVSGFSHRSLSWNVKQHVLFFTGEIRTQKALLRVSVLFPPRRTTALYTSHVMLPSFVRRGEAVRLLANTAKTVRDVDLMMGGSARRVVMMP